MTNVVLLCTEGDSTNLVAEALSRFAPYIIAERGEDRATFIKRRIKRLGLRTVIGQIAFVLTVPKILRLISRDRQNKLRDAPTAAPAMRVASANSKELVAWLQRERPKVVVVNGTRILSRTVLQSGPVFINTHCGITPAYRGSHGGYWALAADDPGNCGVTVHVVDPGIDTGDVLAQARISPTRKDNFNTYPLLQVRAALPLLVAAVEKALSGDLRPQRTEGFSGLWYHPTLWGYLLTGLRRGVW